MAVAILRTEKGLDYSNILTTCTDSSDQSKEIRDNQLNGNVDEQLASTKMLGSDDSLRKIGSGNHIDKQSIAFENEAVKRSIAISIFRQ